MNLAYPSARESEVLALYLEGRDHKEIATCLSISYQTVSTHIHNIKKKMEKAGLRIQTERRVVPIVEKTSV